MVKRVAALLIWSCRLLQRAGTYGVGFNHEKRSRGGRKQENKSRLLCRIHTTVLRCWCNPDTHPYKSTYQLEQPRQAARLHGDAASHSSECRLDPRRGEATSRSQTCSSCLGALIALIFKTLKRRLFQEKTTSNRRRHKMWGGISVWMQLQKLSLVCCKAAGGLKH